MKERKNEPPGFVEWWESWFRTVKPHGRREHYAAAFAAGRAERDKNNTDKPCPPTTS